MKCEMNIETYLTDDELLRKMWGKQIVPCKRDAEFVLCRAKKYKQNVCRYHAKIEMNRSNKYNLGFTTKLLTKNL